MHPAVSAVLVVDLIGAIAIAVAMLQAARVAVGWDASSSSRRQLRLERQAEEGSAAARLGAVLHGVSAVGALLLLNHLLPALVPGAMCGVGVMQALPEGRAAAAMRLLSLGALCAWYAADKLNRGVPTGPLTAQSSRMLLVAGGAALVASWRSLWSLSSLDLHKAVSCCAAVYDLGARGANAGSSAALANWPHALLMTGLVAAIGLAAWTTRRARPAWVHGVSAGIAIAVVVIGAWVVVDFTGPVIYGTLGHRCPLCLFLPRHGGFGYLAFGALGWLAFEACSAVAIATVSRGVPELREHATSRAHRAWVRAAIAGAVFAIAAVGPQAAWWLRYGVSVSG